MKKKRKTIIKNSNFSFFVKFFRKLTLFKNSDIALFGESVKKIKRGIIDPMLTASY